MNATPVKRLIAAAALVTAGLHTAVVPASAAVTDGGIQCGFYVESDGNAYYGHCDAPPRTDIVINIKLGPFGDDNFDVCVKPGVTRHGKTPPIIGAAYPGRR